MITHKQIWKLQWAIEEAAKNVGYCQSREERDQFDNRIADANGALIELRRILREEKHNG